MKYIFSENDSYEFYECGTHSEAKDCQKELKEKYNKDGEIDFGSYGWYVRVKK